jgi:hypothetical protein
MIMNYNETQTVTVAYIASNIAGLILLWVAYKNTKLARLLFAILFAWASWVNLTTARANPEVYLEYSKTSVEIYAEFINGWFRENVSTFVTLIAIGQGLIALGMVLFGRWTLLAAIGAIAFLMAIAPLGLYAAFPFSITVSIAAFLIIKRDDRQFLGTVLTRKRPLVR